MSLHHLMHSPSHLDDARAETDQYLAEHPEVDQRLEDAWWVLHFVTDLVPFTPDNAFSGHLLPIMEAQHELTSSTTVVSMGLYKQGLVALRAVLELGLLNVHWDANDDSYRSIQPWLRGGVNTPPERQVIESLRKVPSIARYLDADPDFLKRVRDLSFDLGAYVHTRGHQASSRGLNRRANFPKFSAPAFDSWVTHAEEVVRAVLALHLMKYPMGLQVTPLSEKMGLNTPMGGLVEPEVRDRFRLFLKPAVRDHLQALSDADSDAVALRQLIEALPDLSEDDWERQIREQDEMLILSGGFEAWVEGRAALDQYRSAEERSREVSYQKDMRSWAEAHEALTAEQIFDRHRSQR